MEQHTTYPYSFPARQRSPSAASTRSTGAYQNSSAFSASANPDEDWTKISDLAERRRIQNRIAQRNYRKKLKRRLEDLERRTTSSSASPEQAHRELVNTAATDINSQSQQQIQRRASVPKANVRSQEQHYTLDLVSSNGAWIDQPAASKQGIAYSTASAYSFPDYSTADYFPEDFNSSAYSRMSMMYPSTTYSQDHLQSIPPSLSSMLPSENFKADQYMGSEMLTPFNLSYASLAGYSMPTARDSPEFTSRTPPLTAPSLYYDPSDCSPPQLTLPMTPESRPTSPGIALFDRFDV